MLACCRKNLPSLFLCLIFTTALVLSASPSLARDNFLILLLDDVGVDGINVYSRNDLYGHDGEGANPGSTPTIDGLAADGVLFRNATTNSQCSPTRAELLTGRHAFRTGIGSVGGVFLELTETTLPELLAATHQNAALGKWHLGGGDADHPNNSGFDYFAGALGASVDSYDSWSKTTNGSTVDGFSTYATTDTVNEAIGRVQSFGDDPFLLYVAFNAPHTPWHVPDSNLQGTGIDDSASNPKKWKAMIEAVDTEISRLLASIPQDVLDDTTIFLIGDNGTPRTATESPFDSSRAKDSLYEGGINVPFIVVSPLIDAADRGSESLALINSTDVFATVAAIAGVASNAEDSLSLVPYLEDPAAPTQASRPCVFAEKFSPNGDPPYYSHEKAIRDETFKLIERDGVYEELYNLDDDHWENTNLLPVENLSSEELAAYNSLVEAMEGVDAWRPPSVAEVVPILAWETFTLLCLGVWLTAVVIQRRRSRARLAYRHGGLIVVSKPKNQAHTVPTTPK